MKLNGSAPVPKRKSGAARLIAAWAAFILLGALVFWLPASANGPRLAWTDALFTSTSAVCVTGLSTIDTDRLSPFGQAVLLVLMQTGGLGIGVLSTWLLVAAGRASLSHQYEMQNALAAVRTRPLRLLAWMLPAIVLIEAIGAVILASILGFESPGAWWSAVFHSVSAFCNAGFSLYPDSVARFRANPAAVLTLSALIMLGGLGFITFSQLVSWSRRRLAGERRNLYLHSRAVLFTNAWLWGLGAIFFALLEWDRALAGLGAIDRILDAFFQSVTARTAGFSTVDFSTLRTPTLLLTMVLMLIGGAPGSCAGGIKVTTLVVILAAIRARVRGADAVGLLKRSIPKEVVSRSFHLVSFALLFLAAVVFALSITEEGRATPYGQADQFKALAFEAASALGTVGLSTGLTPLLSPAGKWLIILTMFAGRLGPLAVAVAILRPRASGHYEYPTEEIAVG